MGVTLLDEANSVDVLIVLLYSSVEGLDIFIQLPAAPGLLFLLESDGALHLEGPSILAFPVNCSPFVGSACEEKIMLTL